MSGWDGYPQDREVQGLHLLADAISGELFAMTWWPGHQKWWFEGEWSAPEQMACHIYLGPVITPAQHAAEVEQARRDELEACGDIVQGWLDHFSDFQPEHITAQKWAVDAMLDILDAIRARGGSDAEG